jgi:hypothetical protein
VKREEPRWISPPKDELEKKVVRLHRPLYLSICVVQFNGKKMKKKKINFTKPESAKQEEMDGRLERG